MKGEAVVTPVTTRPRGLRVPVEDQTPRMTMSEAFSFGGRCLISGYEGVWVGCYRANGVLEGGILHGSDAGI